MFLAVDIGNTHTTFGLMREGKVERECRLTTQRNATADEIEVMLRFLRGIEEVPKAEWRGSALCSVVPSVNRAMQTAVRRVTGTEPLVLDSGMDLGLRIGIDNPREVGMDRLANAVAGKKLHGAPLVIIDYGTATTMDIVSREGDYIGGVIMAGIEATADALYIRTSKLPQIEIQRPDSAIGRSTVGAMMSGIYFGSVDAAEGMIGRIEAQLGYEMKVIATGGIARLIKQDMRRIDRVVEDLTLLGIEEIWNRNSPA